jgi:DNA-binding NtrC family response regulator
MTDVLLFDEAGERLASLASTLADQGFAVTHTSNLEKESLNQFDCLVALDDLIDADLTEVAVQLPVVVITAAGSIPAAVASIHRGARDYVVLPLEPAQLVATVERAAASSIVRTGESIEPFPMIGSSGAMQVIKEQIAKAGPTDSNVLILGQSGTGKEVVARALHAASHRASAPLIAVNCATIPQNLIEAELFGLAQYEGNPNARGLVEAADGGTLFLDEIADLTPAAQARLLQVLQGENRKVGSSTSERVDVRVIAASHRNLQQLTDEGQFREDLFYRLNVVTFLLPLLSERKEDILEIAIWLLEKTSLRLNKEGLVLTADARDAMLAYHWPGNVRELENAIERAVILSDNGAEITQTLLAIEPKEPQDLGDPPVDGDRTSLEDYFVRFVTEHQDQMTETEIAEKLGISRKSLWERRQRLSIPRTKTKKRGPRRDTI